MKHGEYKQRVGLHAIDNSEGESMDSDATQISMRHGRGERKLPAASQRAIDFLDEQRTQSGALGFIPAERFIELAPGYGKKSNGENQR